MKRQRRRLALVSAVAIAALSLAGCASNSQSSGSASDSSKPSGSITWFVNKTPTMTSAVYQKVVDQYHKQNPNVTVKVIDSGGQGIADYLKTLIASGQAPDVTQAQTVSPDNVDNWLDLSDQSWVKDAMKTSLGKSGSYEGKVYSVPVAYQVQSLIFYNKDDFTKAGITSLPTTWNQVDDALAKLKAAGIPAMASAGDWVPESQVTAMTYPSLNTHWWNDRKAGKVNFADSAWESNIARFQDWVKEGYVRKDAVGLDYANVTNDFANGKYGMYIQGSFITANIAQVSDPADIGVFAIPYTGKSGKAPLYVGGAMGWEVLKSTKNKAASLDFVKFLGTNKQAIKTLVAADGDYSDIVSYKMTPVSEEIQKLASDRDKLIVDTGTSVSPPGFNPMATQEVQNVFTGQTGPQIAKAMDDWWSANVPVTK
jgi:multiple sugar transport system substrate-binding protein/raffinose/stachyose/melibiose transport system substrate-binding protein